MGGREGVREQNPELGLPAQEKSRLRGPGGRQGTVSWGHRQAPLLSQLSSFAAFQPLKAAFVSLLVSRQCVP